MKFKDYFNSLVSKRKSSTPSSQSHSKSLHKKNHHESSASADCHYDICCYEDINGIINDDQHSRTQVLLARHAELVNSIVGARPSHDNTFSSCSQCRMSHQASPVLPSPLPPPLPPKLALEQQTSFSNRNYSSTLATCSPRRECLQHNPHHHHHHHHHHQQQHQQQQNQTPQALHHPTHFISSQYSTPNPSIISSSNSSLWTTTTSLSKKQRSRIRTNPWIGNTSTNNRSSTFIEPSHVCHNHVLQPSSIGPMPQPEYSIYDPTFHTSPSALIHSESYPQTISNANANTNVTNAPSPPPPVQVPAPTSSVILHQSDSGHGFSLSSSRLIDSSSSSSSRCSSPSPSNSSLGNNTSSDGITGNEKQRHRQKKLRKKIPTTPSPLVVHKHVKPNTNTEHYLSPNNINSDSGSLKRRKKGSHLPSKTAVQYRYQRTSNETKTNSVKLLNDQIHDQHHSRSSSCRSINDHFSLEFEEILENERSYKQRKEKQPSTKIVSPQLISSRKNPFILPLDETNIKLPSPPPILFSPKLTKTNSRAILKHIEEIENEIRLIKNLDLHNNNNNNNDNDDDDNNNNDDEYVLSPHAYPEDINIEDENHEDDVDIAENTINDERQTINEQVNQWVEKCLQTTNNTNNAAVRLPTECNQLANTINDCVGHVLCSNDDREIPLTSTTSEPQKTTKLVTAFYLSSMPARTTKRTSSFINEPFKLEKSHTIIGYLTPTHECPF